MSTKLTWWQRQAARELRRRAGRGEGDPLTPEDWEIVWHMHEHGLGAAMGKVFRALPSSPRCGICSAPFGRPGQLLAGPLGFRPSRKNPTICATCVELSPPGGMTQYIGVLFADLRGFTARFDGADPVEASRLLRRFYKAAEDVLFPDAVIDKLIGDEVMALYLPQLKRDLPREAVPARMVEHARDLLRSVTPFADMGVGLDVGEAYVGNIGDRSLYDFTAVGDVVNTASRLQAQAATGEIVLSERVANGLPSVVGERVELELKGKREPQTAYRVAM